MMKLINSFIIALVPMLLFATIQTTAQTQTTPDVCGYGVVYHRLVDEHLQPVKLNKKVASRIVDNALNCILGRLTESERKKYAEKSASIRFPKNFSKIKRDLVRIELALAWSDRRQELRDQQNVALRIANQRMIRSPRALAKQVLSDKIFPRTTTASSRAFMKTYLDSKTGVKGYRFLH
jgi:hypothetical protein